MVNAASFLLTPLPGCATVAFHPTRKAPTTMQVKDLVATLSSLPQDAEIITFAHYLNGDPMDNPAGMVEFGTIEQRCPTEVIVNIKVNILPDDLGLL